jgi:hypothetical protein
MDSPDQKKLEIMIGDFMKAKLPYFDVCISNTPYQVNFQGENTIRMSTSSNHPKGNRLSRRANSTSCYPHLLLADFLCSCVQVVGAPPCFPQLSSHVPA